jgi:trypsin
VGLGSIGCSSTAHLVARRLMRNSIWRLTALAATIHCTVMTPEVAAQESVTLGGRKIVGGIPTTITQHPWQVALIVTSSDGRYLCGGSIIAEQWVLTAAHCFGKGSTPSRVIVKANATDYRREGFWIVAERPIKHDKFNSQSYEHDIALIKLSSSPRARVIPRAAPSTNIDIGEHLVVTGWGVEAEGGSSQPATLLKAEVPYVTNETCNAPEAYAGRIFPGMLCAGEKAGGVDSCQGDSGGPLVKGTTPETAILVGVVSFGDGCARELRYGVYTRVSTEQMWISDTLASDGTPRL